ncbi:uncharacterized protein [Onthophagus taurus]|uniref:uncharacterized protein n=1 Tax=Onthophagus taurus TaxID=166361 RepID=UPI0039BE6124
MAPPSEQAVKDLNPVFERQNELYHQISRSLDNFKKLAIVKRPRGNIQSRLDRLEVNWNEFNNSHTLLSKYKSDCKDKSYFSDDIFFTCEEEYIESKGAMLDFLNDLSLQNVNISTSKNIQSQAHHLPQINLPKFNGKYCNWSQFKDLFMSMIHDNDNISDVEKLHYLKMSLSDEPSQLLKNVVITNDNFSRAWQMLLERYENKRLLIDSQLNTLFNSRSLKNDSSLELKRLLGEVKESLGALEALGCPIKHWDHVLVYMIVRKLDVDTIKDWEKSLANNQNPPSYDELELFLLGRLHALETIEQLANRKINQNSATYNKNSNVKSFHASPFKSTCVLCQASHYLSGCQQYLTKTPNQRSDFVVSKNLCFNCLGPHLRKNCRISKRCRICQKQHHTSLHDYKPSTDHTNSHSQKNSNNLSTQLQVNAPTFTPISTTSSHLIHSHHVHTPVLLATALVGVTSHLGERRIVRALIDQGSEVSFISEGLVQQLKLPRHSKTIPISGIGSQQTSISHGSVQIQLFSRINESYTFTEDALILSKLTAYLPQRNTVPLDFDLSDILLADPDFTSSKKIDLILGVGFYSKIIQTGIRKNHDGSLMAQQTSLGWILSGSLSSSPEELKAYGFQCSIDYEFLDLMQRFWKQEENLCNLPPCLSPEEVKCEEHFAKTYSRNSNGRFIVRLPFSKSPQELGNSYTSALQMFKRMELRQLSTVTYGLSSAPYLALRCLRQLADDNSENLPQGSEILKLNTYVDDIFSGANSIDKVHEIIFELNKILKSAGFTARKWVSNHQDALVHLPLDVLSSAHTYSVEEDNKLRALGLLWNNIEDLFLFVCRASYNMSKSTTKREVLSFIARLFDPLGWLSPLTIIAKVFMQQLWVQHLDWDENLPNNLEEKWQTFIKSYNQIPTIHVPRWLGTSDRTESIEVHGFSDASFDAYGAVVYLRVLTNKEVRVSLLISKSKVSPLKRVTIPRLELCAAVLLTRLIKRVQNVLNLSDCPVHLWTDSTVVLAWIKSHPSRWKDYVRNRVTEIHELVNVQWHHVPSGDNPADLVSRGVSVAKLQENSLWWVGPSWLVASPSEWPSIHLNSSDETDLERRLKSSNISTKADDGWDLKHRYSSLRRLLRITAWCMRIFKRNNLYSHVSDVLSPAEINNALMFWVRESQQLQFSEEITLLSSKRVIPKSSSLFRLSPFIDGNGFLRITGRLKFANLEYDEKHPIIILKLSVITSLIIDHHHKSTLHGGTQFTLSSIRRRFWVVGGRVPVRSYINRCMVCAKHKVITSQQLMGQLPPARVNQSRPFLHSGVDYAGPFQLRTMRGRGGKLYKSYLIIFICLSTSAVHVVTDYTTDGFLAAYKRFTGRRGICECLYSDCGTNLIGADRELRALFNKSSNEWKHLANILSNDGTNWKFNPPSAPHLGGKWEGNIRIVKSHLKKIIGFTTLTYEEFVTVLVQIEAVMNSRPLCAVSNDPLNYDVLTPGHFLIGSSLAVVPEPSLLDFKISRLSRWQHLRQMIESFWKHWSVYYLQSIQNASKWFEAKNIPQLGRLDLIKDERLPPSKWAIARITEMHSGPDGRIRVVTLRTPTTTLMRPITKICLLPEVETDDSDTQ